MKAAILRRAKRAFGAAILLATLLVVSLAGYIALERHRLAQFSRTYERPLKLEGNALRVRNELQTSPGSNSLQFIVMPSFSHKWFAVAVAEKGGTGIVEVVIQPVAETAGIDGISKVDPIWSGAITHRKFAIPLADLQRFLRHWDDLTDNYTGEGRVWTDGSRLSFERRHNGRVTSGSGNSPCHDDVLGDWAARQFDHYAPELRDLRAPGLEQAFKSGTCNPSIFSLG